ncbi:magnesium and cobalt transport protein CorA [Cumulibacter manganitolerans]|uniref:magnesium and cobalt transport protein CorA n=1 Tax=Cumulibacter manganitolerans TaxID=1884992 RepID=UPI0012957146|nr:magnesium and cobalt transport protein CorA [Cumulibacter manganitolerans]
MSTNEQPWRSRVPLNPLAVVRRKPLAVVTSSEPRHDAVMGLAVYRDGAVIHRGGSYREAAELARNEGGFVWMGLHEPTQAELESVAAEFGLHPLAVEDAVSTHNRPKLEDYAGTLFMVLKTARYVEHDELTATSEVIGTSEVMVFIGPYFAITVRHGNFGEFGGLRNRLENQDRDLLKLGPAAVMYAICDVIVDRYLDVCTEVETDLDELEASVFSPQRKQQDVGRIYQLKRELLELKRAVGPLSMPLHNLATRPMPQIPDPIHDYFRDVNDHLGRVRDTISGLDELLSSILQASIARISLSENEDMRKITSWAAIGAVPTAVAGIYGMNFKHMPELGWRFGYPLIIAIIVAICVLLYRGFKRNHWL